MSDPLDQEIWNTYQDMKRRDKVLERLSELDEINHSLQSRIDALEKALDSSAAELNRFEKAVESTLYRWFAFFRLGKKALHEKIRQQQGEYDYQLEQLRSLKKKMAPLEQEKKYLTEKSQSLRNIEHQLKSLIRKKAAQTNEATVESPFAAELAEEQRNLLSQQVQIEKLDEVLQISHNGKNRMDQMLKEMALLKEQERHEQFLHLHLTEKEKAAFTQKLKTHSEAAGRSFSMLIPKLNALSIPTPADHQRALQIFESQYDRLLRLLADSHPVSYLLDQMTTHLNHTRNQLLQTIDQLMRKIGNAEESIKKSEEKKALLILLDIKHREK